MIILLTYTLLSYQYLIRLQTLSVRTCNHTLNTIKTCFWWTFLTSSIDYVVSIFTFTSKTIEGGIRTTLLCLKHTTVCFSMPDKPRQTYFTWRTFMSIPILLGGTSPTNSWRYFKETRITNTFISIERTIRRTCRWRYIHRNTISKLFSETSLASTSIAIPILIFSTKYYLFALSLESLISILADTASCSLTVDLIRSTLENNRWTTWPWNLVDISW